jgi:hypothetical protein
MVRRSALALAGTTLLLASAITSRADETADSHATIDLIQRLSYDLRERRLDATERQEIERTTHTAADSDVTYRRYLGKWLDAPALKQLLSKTYDALAGIADVSPLFLRLSAYRPAKGPTVLFLAHTVAAEPRKGAPPCGASATTLVRPWWSDKPVRICAESYHPERSFDEVGYCAGQPEPTVPTPPRPGCGCGPLLLACLPPPEVAPGLENAFNQGVGQEALETVADAVIQRRPFDEVLTVTRTWQSGALEFLYLRRELIGLLHARPYSAELQAQLERRLEGVNLAAPAHWVERTGIYRGTGLLTMPLVGTSQPTYRVLMKNLLTLFLCTEFKSVHVDSDAVLKTVGNQVANLRALSAIGESPMRKQVGCKGCHAPMDNGGAFMTQLATPLFGGYLTELPAHGSLYVKGADDLRGEGVGYAGLARLVIAQPEFERCAAETVFRTLLKRSPLIGEEDLIGTFARGFHEHGHRFDWLVQEVLLSPPYLEMARKPRGGTIGSTVR